MVDNVDPLVEALRAKKQVTLEYIKEKDGSSVTHTGGIHEIGTNKLGKPCLWLWDTSANDHIRQFLLSNIQNYQILEADFFTPHPEWPFKINGEVIV